MHNGAYEWNGGGAMTNGAAWPPAPAVPVPSQQPAQTIKQPAPPQLPPPSSTNNNQFTNGINNASPVLHPPTYGHPPPPPQPVWRPPVHSNAPPTSAPLPQSFPPLNGMPQPRMNVNYASPPQPNQYRPNLPPSQPQSPPGPMYPPAMPTTSSGQSWMPPQSQGPPGPPGPPMVMGPGPPGGPQGQSRLPPDSRRPVLPPTGNVHLMDDMQRMRLHAQESRPVDLLSERNLMPPYGLEPPKIKPPNNVENPEINCDPNIFRFSLGAIPYTNDLLKKSRLPLGLYLHPFKDMKSLNILQVSQIVRCRSCRTYVNPFVQFTDARHWRCNICFRTNDLPDDFSWDPVTKSYGDPQRRPEIRHSTIEFIAPSEYMPIRKDLNGTNQLRPPQPAVYVFVLDVSANAVDTGYLGLFSERLAANLNRLPGDRRLQVAFIAVDSAVHFFRFVPGAMQPQQLVVTDLEDVYLPSCSGLLVNLEEQVEVVTEFVQSLPTLFGHSHDTHNALGAAVTAAHALIAEMGGRVTVMQTVLPDVGPGALKSREDPNLRASNEVHNLGPATDFYKQLALECNGHQVCIDLFMMNAQYADLATLSGMSKHCSGTIHHFPGLHILRNRQEADRYTQIMNRYLTRKIGFESVLRIRCTRGVSLHTFFGNFFVRSTDLLAMPNVNPDTALGAQIQIEETIESNHVAFQAALLYTSSKGDRRIRVHTLCLPVVRTVSEVHASADVEATVSLLAKLASERSCVSQLSDAREALVNSVVDALGAFRQSLPGSHGSALLAPRNNMKLLPLFVLGLLKHPAFSSGTSIKLDKRFYEMCQFKTAPLYVLMLEIYPALYAIHSLDQLEENALPARLQCSYEFVSDLGVFLMDTGSNIYIYIGRCINEALCRDLFDVPHVKHIDDDEPLPKVKSAINEALHSFISDLQSKRAYHSAVQLIREDGPKRELFTKRLVDDRSESSHSYIEFIQHLRTELAK